MLSIDDKTNNVVIDFQQITDATDKNSFSFTKKDKDLVINHLYSKKSGGTITIKDYFTEGLRSDLVYDVKYKNISVLGKNGTSHDLEKLLELGINIIGEYDKDYNCTGYLGTSNNDVFTHKSGSAEIFGGDGDDIYNVDINKSNTYIFDGAGKLQPNNDGNNTLNINERKGNLALVFNVNKDGKVDSADSIDINEIYISGHELFIFNKKSLTLNNLMNYFLKEKTFNGVIEIDDYFGDDSDMTQSGSVYSENEYVYLETINTKEKKGSYSKVDMDSWINQVASEVADWLNNKGYDSTADVIDKSFVTENTSDINSLLKVYQTGYYQG